MNRVDLQRTCGDVCIVDERIRHAGERIDTKSAAETRVLSRWLFGLAERTCDGNDNGVTIGLEGDLTTDVECAAILNHCFRIGLHDVNTDCSRCTNPGPPGRRRDDIEVICERLVVIQTRGRICDRFGAWQSFRRSGGGIGNSHNCAGFQRLDVERCDVE